MFLWRTLGARSRERHSVSKYNSERNYIRGWSFILESWSFINVQVIRVFYVSPKFMDLGASTNHRYTNIVSIRNFNALGIYIRHYSLFRGDIDYNNIHWYCYVSPKFMDLGVSNLVKYIISMAASSTYHIPFIFEFTGSFHMHSRIPIVTWYYVSPIIVSNIYLKSDYTKFEF